MAVSWLGLSGVVSCGVGSIDSGCGSNWGSAGVLRGCVRESDGVGIGSVAVIGWGRGFSLRVGFFILSWHRCFLSSWEWVSSSRCCRFCSRFRIGA